MQDRALEEGGSATEVKRKERVCNEEGGHRLHMDDDERLASGQKKSKEMVLVWWGMGMGVEKGEMG